MLQIYKDLANVLGGFDIQFNQGFIEQLLCEKYSTDDFTFKGDYQYVVLVKSSDAAAVVETLKACPDVTKTKVYPKINAHQQRFFKVLYKDIAITFIEREVIPKANNRHYSEMFGKRVSVPVHTAIMFKLMLKTLRNGKIDGAVLPVLVEMVANSNNNYLFDFYVRHASASSHKLNKAKQKGASNCKALELFANADVQIAELLDTYHAMFKNNPKNIVNMHKYLQSINWPMVLL